MNKRQDIDKADFSEQEYPETKNKSKAQKKIGSILWDYFIKCNQYNDIKINKSAKCKNCQKIIPTMKGNTTGLMKHLKCWHKKIYSQYKKRTTLKIKKKGNNAKRQNEEGESQSGQNMESQNQQSSSVSSFSDQEQSNRRPQKTEIQMDYIKTLPGKQLQYRPSKINRNQSYEPTQYIMPNNQYLHQDMDSKMLQQKGNQNQEGKQGPAEEKKKPNAVNKPQQDYIDDARYIKNTSIRQFQCPAKYFKRPPKMKECEIKTHGRYVGPAIFQNTKFVPSMKIFQVAPVETQMNKEFWLLYLIIKDKVSFQNIMNSSFFRKAFVSMGYSEFVSLKRLSLKESFEKFASLSKQKCRYQIKKLLDQQHKFTLGVDHFTLAGDDYLKLLLLTREKSFLISIMKLEAEGQNQWIKYAINNALLEFGVHFEFNIFCILVSGIRIKQLIKRCFSDSKQIYVCWEKLIQQTIYESFYDRYEKIPEEIEMQNQKGEQMQDDLFNNVIIQSKSKGMIKRSEVNKSELKSELFRSCFFGNKGLLKMEYTEVLYKIYKMNANQVIERNKLTQRTEIQVQRFQKLTQEAVIKALNSWEDLLKLLNYFTAAHQDIGIINQYLQIPFDDEKDLNMIYDMQFLLDALNSRYQELNLGQLNLLQADGAFQSLFQSILNRKILGLKGIKDQVLTKLSQKISQRRNQNLISLMNFLISPQLLDGPSSQFEIFTHISRQQVKQLILKFSGVLRYKDQPQNLLDTIGQNQRANPLQQLGLDNENIVDQQNSQNNPDKQIEEQLDYQKVVRKNDGEMQIQLDQDESSFEIEIESDKSSYDSIANQFIPDPEQVERRKSQQAAKSSRRYYSLSHEINVFNKSENHSKSEKLRKLENHLRQDLPVVMKKEGELQYVLDFLEQRIKDGKNVTPAIIYDIMISMLNAESEIANRKTEQIQYQE